MSELRFRVRERERERNVVQSEINKNSFQNKKKKTSNLMKRKSFCMLRDLVC